MNTNRYGSQLRQLILMLCSVGLFFSCQKSELDLDREATEATKPAFTMSLDFEGGLETTLSGEEVRSLELTNSEEDLRSAGISLKRDPKSREFKVNLDISGDKTLPVVIACRRTVNTTKQVFLGKTILTLLAGPDGQATRKFRIEQKGVDFYNLNDDGSHGDATAFNQLQNEAGAKYEVKFFVGAKLEETTVSGGATRYTVHYGLNEASNTSSLVMMNDDGNVSLENVQEKVPFVSSWTPVFFERAPQGVGLTNNHADRIDGIEPISLKPQGSILMFKINNMMDESTINLESLRVYSEALTANVVYAYDSKTKDFSPAPASRFKANAGAQEKYFFSELKPATALTPKVGEKTFFFWAQGLSQEYLTDTWITTSVMAQIKEVQKDGKKYWFNMPLLKTYKPLTKLQNGHVTKTEFNLEDGTPVHPMNLLGYRFPVDGDTDVYVTNWRVTWRGDGRHGKSAFDWNSSEYDRIYTNPDVASNWRRWGVPLEFGKIDPKSPMEFVGTERSSYRWRTTSIRELAALMITGVDNADRRATNEAKSYAQFIKEQAKMEDYPEDSDFVSLIQSTEERTYAIRFLRRGADGKLYMTPYTAAYRYHRNGPWRETNKYLPSSNENSRLLVTMRPLGALSYKYNDNDTGYFSPTFSDDELRKLFDKVKTEDWWQNSPLKEDDVAREYPALGFYGQNWTLQFVGQKISFMTHNAPKNTSVAGGGKNTFYYGYDAYDTSSSYKFDWNSTDDYAPVVLLADRKIIH